MKFLIAIIFTLFFTSISFAQTSFFGKITDKETNEELIGANVVVEQNGVFIVGTTTDYNGDYKIDIEPGVFDVKITMIAYPESLIIGVVVKPGLENKLDVQLDAGLILEPIRVICINIPMIEVDQTTSNTLQTTEEIQRSPSRNTNELIMNTAGVSSARY